MNVAAVVARQGHVWLPRIGWALMLLGAVFAAGNAVLFMTVDGHGGPESKARLLGEPLMGWSHTMGGALALLIGPFQFVRGIRAWIRRR